MLDDVLDPVWPDDLDRDPPRPAPVGQAPCIDYDWGRLYVDPGITRTPGPGRFDDIIATLVQHAAARHSTTAVVLVDAPDEIHHLAADLAAALGTALPASHPRASLPVLVLDDVHRECTPTAGAMLDRIDGPVIVLLTRTRVSRHIDAWVRTLSAECRRRGLPLAFAATPRQWVWLETTMEMDTYAPVVVDATSARTPALLVARLALAARDLETFHVLPAQASRQGDVHETGFRDRAQLRRGDHNQRCESAPAISP